MEHVAGGAELISRIEPLWQALNAHHQGLSPHFADHFAGYSFERRMAAARGMGDRVRVVIAVDAGRDAGYVMATAEGDVGEVASLYVDPCFRGAGVADRLMEMAKAWLDSKGAKQIYLTVAYGNERAFGFYRRHGFYPRLTRLELRDTPGAEG